MQEKDVTNRQQGSLFTTTCWTLVNHASAGDETARHAALETLCGSYWQPLYAFVRRSGHPPEVAQDLTQEFFARLLEKEWLRGVDREKGKFRTFLLTAMQRFLVDMHRRDQTQKRGGGQVVLSWDFAAAEGMLSGAEQGREESPERAFDRRWALTVLERALQQLKAKSTQSGKAGWFAALEPFLGSEPDDGEYDQVARELSLTRNAVASAVKRLREAYRRTIREEIAHTVADPLQVDGEMKELLSLLRP